MTAASRPPIFLIPPAGSLSSCAIVLLDLSLHDSKGAETYYSVRAFAPQIAVAILSGDNDQDLALQLVQSGAQDYAPKDTLTPDMLMRCITYAMKRQQSRIEMENLTERLRRTTEELKAPQTQLIQAHPRRKPAALHRDPTGQRRVVAWFRVR